MEDGDGRYSKFEAASRGNFIVIEIYRGDPGRVNEKESMIAVSGLERM